MRDNESKPQFQLHVFGDWQTVIAAGDDRHRDQLLNQKPLDQDDADYSQYTINCDTAEQLFAAYERFRREHLTVEIAVRIESQSTGVKCFAATGTGYGSTDSCCIINVDTTAQHERLAAAVREAVDVLSKVQQ